MIELINIDHNCLALLTAFFERINSSHYIDLFSPHPFNQDSAARICGYQGRDFYAAVVLDKKEMIGYGMLRGWDDGYQIPSLGLCILEEYQGLGLGEVLLYYLEANASLNNATQVMLKVKKYNEKALKMYQRHDYQFREYNEEFLIGMKMLPEADKG